MSARAANTWASLMNVGPRSARVRVSRSARRRWRPASRRRGRPRTRNRRRSSRNASTNGNSRPKTTSARTRRLSEQEPSREAQEQEEAADVGEGGDEDGRRDGGVDAKALEHHRNEATREARDEQVAGHGEEYDQAEPALVADQGGDQADHDSDGEPVDDADQHLLPHHPGE